MVLDYSFWPAVNEAAAIPPCICRGRYPQRSNTATAPQGRLDPIHGEAYRNPPTGIRINLCGNIGTGGRRRKCSVVIDIDVVYVNMDECTAYCSDGVTRPFYEMYDACAELTQDPDEAMVAIIKIAEDKFIMLGLVGEESVSLH